VAIGILPSPTLVLSVDEVRGVDLSTPLSSTKLGGGVHALVRFAGPDDARYPIVTAATEVRLPDLASAGIELPPGTTYEWGGVRAVRIGGRVRRNDIADKNALPVPVLYEAQSSIRSSTTAP